MTCPRVLLACVLLLAVLPLPVRAQGRTCELMPGASEAHRNETETGQVSLYVSGRARWVCTGGISVQADSAVGQPGTGMLELIGRVVYRDSIKTLTAGWLKYFGEQERLVARENVVLTDLSTGSVVQGPELEYERQTATRPEARTIVRGRPHALFYAADSTRTAVASTRAAADSTRAAPGSAVPDRRSRPPEPQLAPRTPGPTPLGSDSAPPPLEVDADHMEILGQNSFHASGRVELSRGEMHGFGTEARFDQRSGRLLLRDEARIESERFTLFGEQIVGRLVRDTLREVVARQDALLLAEELELQAPELRIFFEEGEMNRLVAWSGVRRSGGSSRAAGDLATNPARVDSAGRVTAGDSAANPALPDSAVRIAEGDAAANPARVDSAVRAAAGDSAANPALPDSAVRIAEGGAAANPARVDSAVRAAAGDSAAVNPALPDSAVRIAAGEAAANPARADSAGRVTAGEAAVNPALPDSAVRIAAGEAAANPPTSDSAVRRPAGAARARALASGFRLIADSIDARAPGQQIERVIAVGEAYAERTVDTLSADLPEVASHDWLQGDTIIGYLRTDTVAAARDAARAPADDVTVAAANDTAPASNDTAARPGWSAAAPGDSTVVRQVLERIVAVGGEGMARSIYRLAEQADSAETAEADRVERPAINYLIAQRITLFLENGAIENVEADGPIEGYHLQPRAPNDTTDSAGVAAPADTAGSAAAPARADTAQGALGGATSQAVPRPGTGSAGVTRQPAKPERAPVE